MTQAGKKKKKANQGKDTTAAGPAPGSNPGPTLSSGSPTLKLARQLAGDRSGRPDRARASAPQTPPRDSPAACPERGAAEWVWPVGHSRRVLVARTAARVAAPRRGERSAVLSPGPGELSMPVRRRPRSSSPQPGAGRREAARAQAGAVAVLTHGGDSGGGGYSPEVSPPQPGLHAGGAGGGDGSGPGSARGPWAALGAPAASPGSGSGRALWHEQGGPLHPRLSQARPYPASAAPLGRPACES